MKFVVNIDVPTLAPAIRFYTAAFDLRCARILDDDVAELSGASCTLYLLAKPSGSVATPSPAFRDYSRHWTPVHLDFVVDNVEQAKVRVIEAGAIVQSECVHWRGSKCITFSDPFGHGFCLLEFSGRTYLNDAETTI